MWGLLFSYEAGTVLLNVVFGVIFPSFAHCSRIFSQAALGLTLAVVGVLLVAVLLLCLALISPAKACAVGLSVGRKVGLQMGIGFTLAGRTTIGYFD